jgi:hypothetical protein
MANPVNAIRTNEGTECAICKEPFNTGFCNGDRKWTHEGARSDDDVYHEHCLKSWLDVDPNTSCPMRDAKIDPSSLMSITDKVKSAIQSACKALPPVEDVFIQGNEVAPAIGLAAFAMGFEGVGIAAMVATIAFKAGLLVGQRIDEINQGLERLAERQNWERAFAEARAEREAMDRLAEVEEETELGNLQ